MLKLNPIHCDKIWGFERWIASTHKDGCQNEFLAAAGGDYPLIVKVIQANDTLSVQVHPDDKWAAELEGADCRGKTECWFILDAEPNARLVYGMKAGTTTQKIAEAIESGTLETELNFVPVKKGDFIFIPSGTVHAIGGGIRLLEVQQSSNVTYRLYDWNRGRELHVEKSLKVLNVNPLEPIGQFGQRFECKYFGMEKFKLANGNRFHASVPTLLFAVESNGARLFCGYKTESFGKEEIVFLSTGDTVEIEGCATIMGIFAK